MTDMQPVFQIGQKLYFVKKKRWRQTSGCESRTFTAKCPVCNDTKTIVIKGYEIPCSYCAQRHTIDSSTSLTLTDYHVMEYLVRGYDIVGSTYKADYRKNENGVHISTYHIFARTGNGYDGLFVEDIGCANIKRAERLDLDRYVKDPAHHGAENVIFMTKKDAEAFLKRIVEFDKNRLAEYNAKYGTDYTYPFGNDKR